MARSVVSARYLALFALVNLAFFVFYSAILLHYVQSIHTMYFEITAKQDIDARLYWRQAEGTYSETASIPFVIHRGHHYYNRDDINDYALKIVADDASKSFFVHRIVIKPVIGPEIFFLANGDTGEFIAHEQPDRTPVFWKKLIDALDERYGLSDADEIVRQFVRYLGVVVLWAGIYLCGARRDSYLALRVVALLLVFFAAYRSLDYFTTRLTVDITSTQPDTLQVYWSERINRYNERHSRSINIHEGTGRYTLTLQNLNHLCCIRIDPLEKPGDVLIHRIEIREPGYRPIVLAPVNHFDPIDLRRFSEVFSEEADGLRFRNHDGDAHFEFTLKTEDWLTPHPRYLLRLFAGFYLMIIALYTVLGHSRHQHDCWIHAIRMALASILCWVMMLAYFSPFDIHPDERAHIASIDYYTRYSDPPPVGDQRALDTYQYPWGVSRLDSLGISYFLAGKLKAGLDLWTTYSTFTARAFNVLLLTLLVIGACRNRRFVWFLLPLLATPQIWYLFAYANRDAFVWCIAALLAWQLVNPRGALRCLMVSDDTAKRRHAVLYAGVLTGVLALEVESYALFILYAGVVSVWEICTRPAAQRRRFLAGAALVLLVAGGIYGARKAYDVAINGWNKLEKQLAFAETVAAPNFRPSVAGQEGSYFALRLYQRGVEAEELFSKDWNWHGYTWMSFTGLYGNESLEYSPEWYYQSMLVLYLAILGLILHQFFYLPRRYQWLTVLSGGFAIGAVLLAFLYSWLYDFQPQGRYVFPLWPIVMVYLAKTAPHWQRWARLGGLYLALLAFVLAAYSFRHVALPYLIDVTWL